GWACARAAAALAASGRSSFDAEQVAQGRDDERDRPLTVDDDVDCDAGAARHPKRRALAAPPGKAADGLFVAENLDLAQQRRGISPQALRQLRSAQHSVSL